MTLMSPTGQVVFSFDSNSFPSQSIGSTHSLPLRPSSLTSTADSDGYFSEIEVFDNDEMADSTSDTIKTLLSAPLSSSSSLASKARNLPCPTPIRPSRTNSSPQIHVPSTTCITKKPHLKVSAELCQSRMHIHCMYDYLFYQRSSPSSEFVQLHQPKRPPLPFLHCSNSQDSPITLLSSHTKQLKVCPLRARFCAYHYSNYYCTGSLLVALAVLLHASHQWNRKSCSSVSKGTHWRWNHGKCTLIYMYSRQLFTNTRLHIILCTWVRYYLHSIQPYALPLVNGSLPGLKCVSPETLGRLMAGEFTDRVDTYTIIDCRYPYEYEGGHIQGAVNIYEEEVLKKKFFSNPEHPKQGERIIYIFHCEFSSKRGPKM